MLAIFLVAVVAPAPATAAGTWSIVASPNRSGQAGNVVNGVSCVSADWCVAVGAYTNGIRGQRSLVEWWNGSSWSIVPSPNAPNGGYATVLQGVSCVSANSCAAVGKHSHLQHMCAIQRQRTVVGITADAHHGRSTCARGIVTRSEN